MSVRLENFAPQRGTATEVGAQEAAPALRRCLTFATFELKLNPVTYKAAQALARPGLHIRDK